MKKDKLSIFISLVLRHKPDAAGIKLDSHGWADVTELINGIRHTGREIAMSVLKQGHSLPVDVGLKEAMPPEFLYHGTADRFEDGIMKEGLKPMSRLYVHLSKDVDTALNVGRRHGNHPVVFRICSRRMHEDGVRFYLSENGVWLTKKVPPEYIERL